MTDFAAARRHMVDGQLRTADVTDLRLLGAMDAIARESFVPPAAAPIAYLDQDVPVGEGRRLLKPMVLAKLIQGANIEPSDSVLDVGCATGYGAAVLARMAGTVVALEQDASLSKTAAVALSGISTCDAGKRTAERRLAAGGALQCHRDRGRNRSRAARALRSAQGRRPPGLRARRRSRCQGHGLYPQWRRCRRKAAVQCQCTGAAGIRAEASLRFLILH